MDGIEYNAVFEEDDDDDDDDVDADDIHPNIPINGSDFKVLFENSDNDLDNEWRLVTFFYCKRMRYIKKFRKLYFFYVIYI